MGLYTSFKTDDKKETDGVTIVYNQKPEYKNKNGTWPTFVVRRCGGKNTDEYNLARDRARSQFKAQLAVGELSEEQTVKVMVDAFVDALLVSWSNIFIINSEGEEQEVAQDHTEISNFFVDVPEFFLELHAKIVGRDLFLISSEKDIKNS